MELLAPVGSVRALYAAINSGADAVYLGVDGFNARAKAKGFTTENINYYIDLCHLHGVKVYITFNTAVKEKELEELSRFVAACTRADAFIVADPGTLDIFSKYDVPLHASTQMGVNNLEGALFMQKKGFTRVVVARETAKEDIIAIKKNTSLELEYFVHGALCVSYSGSCLLSSMMSGDSGNRGRCNQPCRLPYRSSISGKEGYLLSPSEQCLITKLDELKKIGVDSLKIEGRLKQPHYVSTVVSQYRKALNGAKADKNAVSELKKAFNRGEFTCGYIFDDTKEIMSPKVQSNIGVVIGKVISCDKTGVTVKAFGQLRDGDGLKLLYNGEEVGGFGVKILKKDKDIYKLSAKGSFPVGTEVRRTLDSHSADEEVALKKIEAGLSFICDKDLNVTVSANACGVTATVTGRAQQAVGRPLTAEDVVSSLKKLGDTPFECSGVFAELSGQNIFMAKSVINELRRKVVRELERAIIERYEKNMQRRVMMPSLSKGNADDKGEERRVIVNTDDLNVIKSLSGQKISISFQTYNFSRFISDIDIFLSLIENNFQTYLHLPPVVRGDETQVLRDILDRCKGKITGLVCENYYAVELAEEYGFKTLAGIRLNVFNSHFKTVSGMDDIVFSPELTLKEIDDIGDKNGFVYAYGLLPVMTLCHCPVQVSTGCGCGNCAYEGDFYYSDKIKSYLVKRTKIKHCIFELFNPAIVDISAKAEKIRYNLYINMVNCKRNPLDVVFGVTRGGAAQPASNCAHLFRGIK